MSLMVMMMMMIRMIEIGDNYVSGVRQGGIFSPFLFHFYVHGIITNVTGLHRKAICQLPAKI